MIGFKTGQRKSSSRRAKRRRQSQKRKYLRYGIFAVACYVVFLVATFPASLAVSFFGSTPQLKKQLQITAASGTVWSGSAANVRVSGINLGQLKWELKLLPLLIGNLEVYIKFANKSAAGDDISGSGYVSPSLFGGDISVNDFTLSTSADAIAPLMYGLPARFGGDINAHIKSLELVKGKTININARVVVTGAGLVSPQKIDYGDILIKASPDKNGSVLVLSDQGGPLILDGNIKIKGNGLYTINLGLGARNSASADLENGLRFIGRRDPTGKYNYRTNGKLRNW